METTEQPRSLTTWQQVGVALAFVAVCLGAGWLMGALVDTGALEIWRLRKPFYYPPEWLFAPVWAVLYVMMGIAAFLVWRAGFDLTDVRIALALFAGQLVLNLAWTPVFFGAQSVGGALLVIIALLALLVLTTQRFLRVNRVAGYLLVPYLAWVAYATLLNFGIWVMN